MFILENPHQINKPPSLVVAIYIAKFYINNNKTPIIAARLRNNLTGNKIFCKGHKKNFMLIKLSLSSYIIRLYTNYIATKKNMTALKMVEIA